MPQSEDKLALDALNKEIELTNDFILEYNVKLRACELKLRQLEARKKSMENYLNSDNN